MKHKTQIIMSVMASTLLTACSTTSETFDCEAGHGVGCKSITQVNKMVDEGIVGNVQEGTISSSKTLPPVISANPSESDFQEQSLLEHPIKLQRIVLSDNSVINRASEESLRIWIAPFQDEQGNFHEGSFVHTIIRPSYWHMQVF